MAQRLTESSDTLHSDDVARVDIHIAKRVEHSDTGTNEGCSESGVHVGGNGHHRFSTEGDELSIASVAGHSIDVLVRAGHKVTIDRSLSATIPPRTPQPM